MRKRKSPIDSFRSAVKDYFTFTTPEKHGIFGLLIIFILLTGTVIFVNFTSVFLPGNSADFENAVKSFDDLYKLDSLSRKKFARTTLVDSLKSSSPDLISRNTKVPEKYFVFNPNNLPDSLWMQLGLIPKQIGGIKKYESKGGKFFKKEDLKKMYTISEKKYRELEPYISIPETKKTFTSDTAKFIAKESSSVKKPQLSIVDLNVATAEELDALPAIGASRAASILKYGELLGGYTATEQLKEARGMNDSVYDAIKNFVTIRAMNIRKVNINTSDPQQLKHPYISFSLAKVITNYRKMHGDYKDVSDIKKLGIVNNELYKKLSPYLTIQ